ncbi:PREDICTED: DNA annealing helicase and endonuclease ZRANB3 isoform X2 [Nelumbo nucifera]|uniref:DNA annealing helicase and endonuclease ZRANB3 isoform X2 n=1 Tax=Nelumbo nucifera TaxID=4432 RepID=A0A1U8A0F7_NELNU|nr:PREDICTED: DNA annealing helicase and endonuclease ZRANB3 isoform X2 [Nelumbo nucifera]
MEISEEQRKRAEANRLSALAKRQAASALREDPWKLFKCRKVLQESRPLQVPDNPLSDVLQKPNTPPPIRFRVRLEICSPDSFSVTPEPLPGFPYPGETICLEKLNECLSFVVPSHYTQNTSGGKDSVYKLNDYGAILKCLKRSRDIECEGVPNSTLIVVQKLSESFVVDRWVPCRPEHLSDVEVDALIRSLPKMLLETLLPFQLDGVRFALRRGGRCLIADEMGLGKTLQAIAIACCFMNEGPILVVCPAILRFPWAEELERWLPFCLPTDIHLVFGHQDNPVRLAKFPRVVVISYTMLHHLHKSMLDRDWAVLIVDESHHIRCTIKKSEPLEIKAVLDVATKSKRIILLSGTPSLSRPYDIFHQINMLWPGLLGKDKYEFVRNYCVVESVPGSQKRRFRGVRLEELNVLLKLSVMIRRLKKHVLVQLPPKRRQVITLILTSEDIKSAKAAVREVDGDLKCMERKDVSEEDAEDDDDYLRTSRNLSDQELGAAKLSGFREWFSFHPIVTEPAVQGNSNMDHNSHKMLIFAHHHVVLKGVQELAVEKGIKYVCIHGKTPPMDRQAAVKSFRSLPEVKIAIIGITAASHGLDFSLAQNVVFLELPKTPNLLLQAEDRAHRRGQTNSVNIYIFCAKDTLDESRWQNLNKIVHCCSSVTNGKYDVVKEIAVEKVSDLNLERSSAEHESPEGNGTDVLEAEASGSNIVGVHDKLPIVGQMVYGNSAVNGGTQLVKMYVEIAEEVKDGSDELVEAEPNNSMQMDFLHYQSKKEDFFHLKAEEDCDFEMAMESGPNIIFEESASEALQIWCPKIVSARKLEKDSEKDESLEKLELEGNLLLNSHSTLSQKKPVNVGMQANIACALTSNEDLLGPIELSEPESSGSIQACYLRFQVSHYTGRIHLYSCIAGKDLRPRPLFKNFRPEELESLSLSPDKDKGLLKGRSKRRATPLHEISHPLPENAIWKKISLHSGYGKKEKVYTQGWTIMGEPLCKLCQTPCKGQLAKIPEFFEDLFCNMECFEEYRIRTSRRSLREALFQLEHGICTLCKLDCHKLVERIRPLSVARRMEYIEKEAPKIARHKNLFDKLVSQPIDGNSWHADHIVPVYQGGGECRLDNMRTLCVACHFEVTAAQRAERCLARIKAKDQLKVVMNELKDGDNTKLVDSNVEVHGNSETLESIDDDELLIKVPGSAYSAWQNTPEGTQVEE